MEAGHGGAGDASFLREGGRGGGGFRLNVVAFHAEEHQHGETPLADIVVGEEAV